MQEPPDPLRLPKPDAAEIPEEKLTQYALNPDHEPYGKHKARVFQSALGIGRDDWRYLRDQILQRLSEGDVKSVEPSRWGYQYRVTVWIDGLNGARHPVATRWIVEGNKPPRLTSVWVEI